MLQFAPILIGPKSARSTAPNQMLVFSPISTSPTKVAFSARNALGAMRGERPSNGTMIAIGLVQFGAGKVGLGVAKKHLLKHVLRITKSAPALYHHLVLEHGIIAAKHDALLQTATNLSLQSR